MKASSAATASRRAIEIVSELRGGMSDLGGVARLPEDLKDVRRSVGEEVARMSSKELARVGADDPLLPVIKHDRPMMLPARSVLRKEARPVRHDAQISMHPTLGEVLTVPFPSRTRLIDVIASSIKFGYLRS
jgi:hypothetical protein